MTTEPNWLDFFNDRERLHAEHYLSYAEQYAQRDPEAYEALEAEIGNILKTADWFAENEEGERVLKLAEALWQESDFIFARGFTQRGFPILEYARQAARNDNDTSTEFNWVEVLAKIQLNIGNLTEARKLFDEALCLVADNPEAGTNAGTQLGLGRLSMELNDFDQAQKWLELALNNFRENQIREGEIEAITALGNLYSLQGDADTAISCLEEGLPLSILKGDLHGQVALRFALGFVGTATENWKFAIPHYEEAVAAAKAVGSRHFVVRGLHNLGEAWLELKDTGKAKAFLEEAAVLQEELDDPITKAFTHFYLGKTYYELGRWNDAIAQMKLTYPFRTLPIQIDLAAEASWIIANCCLNLDDVVNARRFLKSVIAMASDVDADLVKRANAMLDDI